MLPMQQRQQCHVDRRGAASRFFPDLRERKYQLNAGWSGGFKFAFVASLSRCRGIHANITRCRPVPPTGHQDDPHDCLFATL